MTKKHKKQRVNTIIAALDWCYYLLIFLTVVIFFLYRQGGSLRWLFLAPIGLAVGVRIASLLLKQKKEKNYE